MFRYREERGWDNSNIKEQSMVKCFRRCWPLLKCFHVYIHLLPFGTIHKRRHQSGKGVNQKSTTFFGRLSNVDVFFDKKRNGWQKTQKNYVIYEWPLIQKMKTSRDRWCNWSGKYYIQSKYKRMISSMTNPLKVSIRCIWPL